MTFFIKIQEEYVFVSVVIMDNLGYYNDGIYHQNREIE